MCSLAIAALLLFLSVGRAENEAPPGENKQLEKERAAQALELCRKGANEYRLFLDDSARTELELEPDPILRWSNPTVGSIHGAVFVWTDKGRPAVIASIFKWFDPLNHMAFEVHSLAPTPVLGNLGNRNVWKTPGPGVEFKPVKDAPRPAATASARLTQMRSISKSFAIEKTDRDDQSQQSMRLLTQPVYRYESESAHILDGAIFSFVQGTDPEVLLLLEAQDAKDGVAWHYALARMNSCIFKAKYQDRKVWSTDVLPWDTVFDNRSAYNILNLDHLSPPKK
jgi:hypothetical protein